MTYLLYPLGLTVAIIVAMVSIASFAL